MSSQLMTIIPCDESESLTLPVDVDGDTVRGEGDALESEDVPAAPVWP